MTRLLRLLPTAVRCALGSHRDTVPMIGQSEPVRMCLHCGQTVPLPLPVTR